MHGYFRRTVRSCTRPPVIRTWCPSLRGVLNAVRPQGHRCSSASLELGMRTCRIPHAPSPFMPGRRCDGGRMGARRRPRAWPHARSALGYVWWRWTDYDRQLANQRRLSTGRCTNYRLASCGRMQPYETCGASAGGGRARAAARFEQRGDRVCTSTNTPYYAGFAGRSTGAHEYAEYCTLRRHAR